MEIELSKRWAELSQWAVDQHEYVKALWLNLTPTEQHELMGHGVLILFGLAALWFFVRYASAAAKYTALKALVNELVSKKDKEDPKKEEPVKCSPAYERSSLSSLTSVLDQTRTILDHCSDLSEKNSDILDKMHEMHTKSTVAIVDMSKKAVETTVAMFTNVLKTVSDMSSNNNSAVRGSVDNALEKLSEQANNAMAEIRQTVNICLNDDDSDDNDK